MNEKILTKRGNSILPMILGIILGLLVGGGVALLVAPASGTKTRHMIKDKTGNMVQGVKDTASNITGQVSDQARKQMHQMSGAITNRRELSQQEKESRHAAELERDINILEDDIDKTYNL